MHSLVLKLVFSNLRYTLFACIVFTAIFLSLIYISEYLFISPYVVLHIPSYDVLGFVLILIVSILTGLVSSMSAYLILTLKSGKKQAGSGLAGSIIGTSAGMCSCGSVGFAIISVFGTVGGTATSFLNDYEIPLRIFSIVILSITYFYMIKRLSSECNVKTR